MAHLIEVDWRELWQGAESTEAIGAVFTKPFVVEFILDLAGYKPELQRLSRLRLLEPGCGDGAFITCIVKRLISSELIHGGEIHWDDPQMESAITATDIDANSLDTAINAARKELMAAGCPPNRVEQLLVHWFRQTDFLLETWKGQFDVVTGNPPYVRIEALPRILLSRYRQLYATTSDRADLYVAFIERSLELLSPDGVLAFICANRFAKNKYGAALRRLISEQYHVAYYVNLEHAQPFTEEVSAYPAVIVIDRHPGRPTMAATAEDPLEASLATLRGEAIGAYSLEQFSQFKDWYPRGAPWISTSIQQNRRLEQLQSQFPLLEQSASNTRVGIGVATGADGVFILSALNTEIEPDRQIPVAMASDIRNDGISFSGHYILNPFSGAGDGVLVDLEDYPGLARYLKLHRETLEKRHVARQRSRNWYRTIDRIWPALQFQPKLLIPDIKSSVTIGIDSGQYYPHHNLYWIVSDWPLPALKALLRSTRVDQQVRAYSVQMRGGHLRFQAQTLRKLRIPALGSLGLPVLQALQSVHSSSSQPELDDIVEEAYEQHQKKLSSP